MNASLFSILLYLVLFLQDVLGYSALGTGIRLLLNSGAVLIAATIAGRLIGRVSVRWLIGPGLALVGIGLLLMTGLDGSSSWTHLVPGFIVSGFGAGMVNPPLASTAIGVVEPQRAGMASGVNSTFRQIGIATSIAVQGTIFTAALDRSIHHALAPVPALASHSSEIVNGIRQGTAGNIISTTPPALRASLAGAVRSSFATGINDLALFTGIIALVGAVASIILIRNRDFVVSGPPSEEMQAVAAG